MNFATDFIGYRRTPRWGIVLLAAAALWHISAGNAPASAPPIEVAWASAPAMPAPILLADEEGWSWRSLLKPVEFLQGSRRNMIQAATVGMCIALYIIWWRRAVEK
jgi:hypothetical protein